MHLLVAVRPAALAETASDQGAVYKIFTNRAYLGEVVLKRSPTSASTLRSRTP
jgi:hypothetical protein